MDKCGGYFMGIASLSDLLKEAGFDDQAKVYLDQLNAEIIAEINLELESLENILNTDEFVEIPSDSKDLILQHFKNIVRLLTEGKSNILVKRNKGYSSNDNM